MRLITSLILLIAISASAKDVYTTPTGAKYHTHKTCQYCKGKDLKTITEEQAKKDGKTLCKRCSTKDQKK